MAWNVGEAESILKILGLSVTAANLTQVDSCMDELSLLSPASEAAVQALLADYEAAEQSLATLNTTGTGKTLIQADVLKWEVDKGSGYTYSPVTEMQRLAGEILRYFGPCMGIEPQTGYFGTASLIRS
jgi:hypothetical protein